MVRAWYMNNDAEDKREPHHVNPPKFLTLEDLREISGVEYFKLNLNSFATDGILDGIKKERGFTYEDELVCSKEHLANLEEKLKTFYTEHLHTEEEIRFCLEGSGYFDVRDKNDEWIRVEVTPGDLIALPSGIYHRFTLDTNNFVRLKRFFIGKPVWAAHNRPADNLDCRKAYLQSLQNEYVNVT